MRKFEKLAELLSDKATVEITSKYDGVITKLYHQVGDVALVGKPLIDIQVSDSVEDGSPKHAHHPTKSTSTAKEVSVEDSEVTVTDASTCTHTGEHVRSFLLLLFNQHLI